MYLKGGFSIFTLLSLFLLNFIIHLENLLSGIVLIIVTIVLITMILIKSVEIENTKEKPVECIQEHFRCAFLTKKKREVYFLVISQQFGEARDQKSYRLVPTY